MLRGFQVKTMPNKKTLRARALRTLPSGTPIDLFESRSNGTMLVRCSGGQVRPLRTEDFSLLSFEGGKLRVHPHGVAHTPTVERKERNCWVDDSEFIQVADGFVETQTVHTEYVDQCELKLGRGRKTIYRLGTFRESDVLICDPPVFPKARRTALQPSVPAEIVRKVILNGMAMSRHTGKATRLATLSSAVDESGAAVNRYLGVRGDDLVYLLDGGEVLEAGNPELEALNAFDDTDLALVLAFVKAYTSAEEEVAA